MDVYLNETTRHAQLILPPTSALEHDHYDLAFHKFAVRNTARYNAPVLPEPAGALHDWEIFAGLAAAHAAADRRAGRAGGARRPAMLDFLLQAGPYGARSAFTPPLSLAALQAHPHGIDLGPLRPSLRRAPVHRGPDDRLPARRDSRRDRRPARRARARPPQPMRCC